MTIHIPSLPMQSRTVQMRELTIGQSLAIAAMPIHRLEASTTAFLRFATEQFERVDPLFWTVEERMMSVAHYLAATSYDSPNFAIGDGHFSDYLIADDKPRQAMQAAGDVGGDMWHVRQLTGQMVEAIERIAAGVQAFRGAAYWVAGRMACQMFRPDEQIPDANMTDGEVDLWLSDRLKIIGSFPESDFMELLLVFESSRAALQHLFKVTSDDTGLIALPKGGAGSPARFPVRSCLGNWATSYGGKSQ